MWLYCSSTYRDCTIATVRGSSLGKVHVTMNNTYCNNAHSPLILIPLENTPKSSLSINYLIDLWQKLNLSFTLSLKSGMTNLEPQNSGGSGKNTKSLRATWDSVWKQHSLQKQWHKRTKLRLYTSWFDNYHNATVIKTAWYGVDIKSRQIVQIIHGWSMTFEKGAKNKQWGETICSIDAIRKF